MYKYNMNVYPHSHIISKSGHPALCKTATQNFTLMNFTLDHVAYVHVCGMTQANFLQIKVKDIQSSYRHATSGLHLQKKSDHHKKKNYSTTNIYIIFQKVHNMHSIIYNAKIHSQPSSHICISD